MDSFLKSVYLTEIVRQCEYARQAASQVVANVTRVREEGKTMAGEELRRLHGEVFRNLHSFLTHASGVSRLLWPGDGSDKRPHVVRARERARELRELLGLPDEHVLGSRKLRDHLEHVDERLDDWAATSVSHNMVSDLIGPVEAFKALDAKEIFRAYNPISGEMFFRGEVFSLKEISDALADVVTRAGATLQTLIAS